MGKGIHNTLVFNGGEVSPKVDARVDVAKYGSWLRQSLNMISYKSGPLTRRPGTQEIALGKYQGGDAMRLAPFIFSPATTFMLEFGRFYVRFYSNGQQVTVSSAPVWISGSNYPAGSFVEDPGATPPDAIYYSAGGINGSVVQPHSDATNWVAQTIYEVPSPYAAFPSFSGNVFAADVYGVVPCQINDVVYLVHPDYPPNSLSRFGDTDWVMKQVPFLSPALLDQNATDTLLTPSALQGMGITVTASAPAWVAQNYYNLANSVEVNGIIYDCILANVSTGSFAADLASGSWQPIGIFNPLHVGASWQLAVLRPSAYVEYDGTASGGFSNGISSTIQCLGAYEVHTYGVWSADIAIQRSLDGGQTWDTVQSVTGRSDRNVDLSGTAAQLGVYRIVVSNSAPPINPGVTNPRVVFECEDAFLYGLVQITAISQLAAGAMVNGTAYEIQTLGTTNWGSIGASPNPFIGEIFQYNGAGVTGAGGTVYNPYVATANVVTQLTDSNALAAQWVTGTAYSAGANVSYGFVNYTAINNVTSATPPPQDIVNWVPAVPGGTEYWSEGAWSNYRGFPQAVTSFQQRMIYASSGYEPQRIWGTVTNDIENFALGDQTLATDAFAFDLNAPSRGPIVWLIAQTDLFAGFSGAEWVINSGSTNSAGGSSGAAITPSNINAFEQGTFGSAPQVQPTIVGNAVMFTQRQADAVRQMLFSVYTEKYMSQDLTTLSDHLFASGIVQVAYQSRWHHQGVLWVVTQQGTLCGLTYDLDQEVFGWCRAQTGYGLTDANGNPLTSDRGFESVAVIDGQGTNDDEVWVTVNRNIGGFQTRFIERLNPVNWEEVFTGAPNPPAPVLAQAFYVDCGKTILNPGSLTITGLSYLNGRQVIGLADGSPFGPLTVTGGAITLPASIPTTVGTVQVGLPIPYAGQPMRLDSSPTQGNLQARTKQVYEWYIRVWNSIGGSISNGTTQYPTWTSGYAYAVGAFVISPLTNGAFQCVVANSGTTDPSASAQFAAVPTPSYQPPVPIPYTPEGASPFAVPVMVTVPTDKKIPAMLMPSPGHDPVFIVQGNDALPLTVLAIIQKLDVISNP